MNTTISRINLRLPLAILAASTVFAAAGKAQSIQPQAVAGQTQYDIGNPSGDETELLCLINRARASPPAEGQRLAADATYFYATINRNTIDPGLLVSQFQSYAVRAPLAFNAKLNASAQAHTAEMAQTGIQQHNSADGTPSGTRVMLFGYQYPSGENCAGGYVLAEATTPWLTHGTYQIDTNFPGNAHRLTIMEPDRFGTVEFGTSQQATWNTEDFGANATPPLVTGVVFTDHAGTSFYASGEGVGGVTVTAPGASSYYATTTPSGAYTLPLDLVGKVYAGGYYDPNTGQYIYSPANPVPIMQVVFTDARGGVTTKAVTLNYTTGTNGVGYVDDTNVPRYANVEVDLVRPFSGVHPAFFAGEVALSQSVYYLAFPASGNAFGYYAYLSDPHFLYHFDLGYEYVIEVQDGQAGLYLYDFASSHWFYTSPRFGFPYLYDFSLNSVLYYYPDPNNPGRYNTDGVRYFYDYATGKIVTL